MKLENRNILLTGAASGMGRACALRFAAEGANVVGADIDAAGLEEVGNEIETAGNGRFASVPGDLTTPAGCAAAVEAAVEAFGGLDVLFHNAGMPGPVGLEVDEPVYDLVMDLMVKAGFYLTRYAVPHLEKAEYPSILLTASISGLKGSPLSIVYGTAKGAVITLTKSLAVSLSGQGIRVNSISPGLMNTPFATSAFSAPGGDEKRKQIVTRIPLGRLGEPEEMANVATFLASREASFITGANYTVDGGQTLG